MMENYFGNVAVICGLVFLIMGFIMYKWPPKTINWLYGYRTGSSMKSQERWVFAQKYSALQMIRSGGALLLMGLALGLFGADIPLITGAGTVGLLISAGYLLITTERAIKKRFDN
ncbi:MAG: SdpI family protein [Bacteroidota bacterium]